MLYPVKATYDIMALISSFGIAYRLAEKYRTIDPLSAGAMSLVAFVMTIPQHTLFTPVHGAAEVIKGVIPVSMVGSRGLFVAIVISLLSTEIYRLVASRNLVIRMPDGVPPAVAKSFLALIPGFCVLAVVLALRPAVEASPFGDINSMIATLIGIPMHHVGGTLPGMIISVIVIGIFVDAGPARRRDCAGIYSAGVAVEYVREPDGLSERPADPAYHYPAILRSVDCARRHRRAAGAGDIYVAAQP